MARNQGPNGHPGDRAYPVEWLQQGDTRVARDPNPQAAARQHVPAYPAHGAGDGIHYPPAGNDSAQHHHQHGEPAFDPPGQWAATPLPQWPAEAPQYHLPGQQLPGPLPADPVHHGGYPQANDLRGPAYDHYAGGQPAVPMAPAHGDAWPPSQGFAPLAPAPPAGAGQPYDFGAAQAPMGYDRYAGAAPSLPPMHPDPAAGYPAQGYAAQGYPAQGHPADGFDPHYDRAGTDPRGYDLSQYGYPQGYPATAPDGGGASQWAAGPDAYGAAPHGHAAPGQPPHGEEYADEYEDEPAPRRRGTLLIVASLVGAIVAGGSMAYAYKTFFGGDGKRRTPVVQADKRPAKQAPAEPGGREFQNTNSKLLSRLDSQSGSRAAPLPSPEDNRVRTVPTVVVGRDGSVVSQPPRPQETIQPTAVPGATVVVPGTSLSGGYGMPRTALSQPAPSSEPRPVPTATINRAAPPAPESEPPRAPARSGRTPPLPERPAGTSVVQRAQTAAAQPPRRVAAVQAAPPAATVAPTAGANGFVAVLSSSRSQIDALKAFADLQQKYPAVLQSRTPEVREADLSARGLGKMYRAVVGPPGSRQAAADVCSRLKTAGYAGCWVSAY